MIPINSGLILSKNTLNSPNAWIVLIEVKYTSTLYKRIAANQNIDIIWNGFEWIALPIEIGIMSENKGEIPKLKASICNIGGYMEGIMEQYDGLIDSTVKIYTINSANLGTAIGVPYATFYIKDAGADPTWAKFVLSVFPSIRRKSEPKERIMKNFCRYNYPHSRDIRCPYTAGIYATCDRTLTACILRNGVNADMFGGFVSIGKNRIYI